VEYSSLVSHCCELPLATQRRASRNYPLSRAILVGFSGIYTSYLEGGFEPDYLAAYLEAYAWGAAVVFFVSICVFPMSSEKELRSMLVGSLQHTASFADLIIKTFALEISGGAYLT
jgi:hypothetical protein